MATQSKRTEGQTNEKLEENREAMKVGGKVLKKIRQQNPESNDVLLVNNHI